VSSSSITASASSREKIFPDTAPSIRDFVIWIQLQFRRNLAPLYTFRVHSYVSDDRKILTLRNPDEDS
jgi:hypothetical protein